MSKLTPAFPANSGQKTHSFTSTLLFNLIQCSKALNNSLGDSLISEGTGSHAINKSGVTSIYLTFPISNYQLPFTAGLTENNLQKSPNSAATTPCI